MPCLSLFWTLEGSPKLCPSQGLVSKGHREGAPTELEQGLLGIEVKPPTLARAGPPPPARPSSWRLQPKALRTRTHLSAVQFIQCTLFTEINVSGWTWNPRSPTPWLALWFCRGQKLPDPHVVPVHEKPLVEASRTLRPQAPQGSWVADPTHSGPWGSRASCPVPFPTAATASCLLWEGKEEGGISVLRAEPWRRAASGHNGLLSGFTV